MRRAVGNGGDWITLSNVGQAYGGVSAILSGLAFCGIACSIFLQWRQNRLTQLTASRERQFELVKLAMADPDLMFQREEGESIQTHTQKMYYNLWVSHWAMLLELGAISESELRPTSPCYSETSWPWIGGGASEGTGTRCKRHEALDS
jgi:Family of unknown function (DUF6082)